MRLTENSSLLIGRNVHPIDLQLDYNKLLCVPLRAHVNLLLDFKLVTICHLNCYVDSKITYV